MDHSIEETRSSGDEREATEATPPQMDEDSLLPEFPTAEVQFAGTSSDQVVPPTSPASDDVGSALTNENENVRQVPELLFSSLNVDSDDSRDVPQPAESGAESILCSSNEDLPASKVLQNVVPSSAEHRWPELLRLLNDESGTGQENSSSTSASTSRVVLPFQTSSVDPLPHKISTISHRASDREVPGSPTRPLSFPSLERSFYSSESTESDASSLHTQFGSDLETAARFEEGERIAMEGFPLDPRLKDIQSDSESSEVPSVPTLPSGGEDTKATDFHQPFYRNEEQFVSSDLIEPEAASDSGQIPLQPSPKRKLRSVQDSNKKYDVENNKTPNEETEGSPSKKPKFPAPSESQCFGQPMSRVCLFEDSELPGPSRVRTDDRNLILEGTHEDDSLEENSPINESDDKEESQN